MAEDPGGQGIKQRNGAAYSGGTWFRCGASVANAPVVALITQRSLVQIQPLQSPKLH